MAVLIKKLIFLIFFAAILAVPWSASAESAASIIVTPPKKQPDGTMLVKLGISNDIKFGICGTSSNPDKMNAVLSGEGTISPSSGSGLQTGYSVARTTGEKCTSDTAIYGPKVTFTYTPPAVPTDTVKTLIIKYFSEGTTPTDNPFISLQFNIKIVDEWPPDAEDPGGSWKPQDVNIATLTNMINISDIFSGNRFDLSNQVDFPTPEGLVQKVADVLLILAGILAVIAFIWSGYQFIMSSGDSAKVEKAKKAMISAFIGVVLIIFAYSIIRAVDIFSSPPLSSSIPEAKFE